MKRTITQRIDKGLRTIAGPAVSLGRRWLSSVMPYRPMKGGKELLDAQYKQGMWDYLTDLSELPRFNVIAGYCHHLKVSGEFLEVGCGEGTLQGKLCPSRYARFVGVDIASEAIERALRRQDEKTFFFRDDASEFRPEGKFDAIIFNECLEYFEDPLELVRRYEEFLKSGGFFIVSMFAGIDTVRTRRIWKRLELVYDVTTEARVSHGNLTWIIKLFTPARP